MRTTHRIPLAAFLLAGVALAAAPAVAQDENHHPAVAHPHPAFHPAMRPAPFRGGFARPGFHPFHAALLAHVGFAHFTPAQRAVWMHGNWYHRSYNGRYGWWWNTGGGWFWYGAPVYPYPTVVSDYYYDEPQENQAGPSWYYCYNPPGYYPQIPACRGPWQPVPPQGYGAEESGPDQGPPPGSQQYDNEQGPPPGYQGPPQGYEQGPPQGYDQEPPPGYEQGPPSGYDQGPPPDGYQGPPNQQQGPDDENPNYPPDYGNRGPG